MAGESRGLPTGTVTFLFTDIESSTETLASIGDEAYAAALDRHRQLLRNAFEAHGGHEVGTEGDAFFVAFARAQDAVGAATDGQRALASQRLRVRMGVHTGDALVREGEYVVGAAAIAYLSGDAARCSRLLAWIRSRTFDVGRIIYSATAFALYRHYTALVRGVIDPIDARRYRQEGRTMSEDEAVALRSAKPFPPSSPSPPPPRSRSARRST